MAMITRMDLLGSGGGGAGGVEATLKEMLKL